MPIRQINRLRDLLQGTKLDWEEALRQVGVEEISPYQRALLGLYRCRCGVWVTNQTWYHVCPHCGIVGIDEGKSGGK